mmetsp:Transcript_24152/g.39933  ORF Transcript_24152/g.39933 Transcript_24152/m.39933 type:complete len:125 (+) Transcript_24152:1085-1459(+)
MPSSPHSTLSIFIIPHSSLHTTFGQITAHQALPPTHPPPPPQPQPPTTTTHTHAPPQPIETLNPSPPQHFHAILSRRSLPCNSPPLAELAMFAAHCLLRRDHLSSFNEIDCMRTFQNILSAADA